MIPKPPCNAFVAIAILGAFGISGVAAEVTFSAQPIWTSQTTHCGGDGNAQLSDFDQDGDLDILTSAPGPKRWVLYVNHDGQLANEPIWESLTTTDCDHIATLDFDGDGRMDIAATHESHCTLYLNRSAADQAAPFTRKPTWETGIYIDANQIDFGDIDQDGDLDMLMAAGLPFLGLALFENQNGTPAVKPTQRIGIREYSETAIFSDFDGDGALDIIATYPRKGTVILHRNRSGRFDEGTLLYEDTDVRHCQRVYCLDLDNDGRKEIACAKGPWGSPGASLILKQQDGTRTLKPVWKSQPQTAYHGFAFADVDADGDLDMAGADWLGRRVSLYLQDAGQFSPEPHWQARTRGQGHEVQFGDLDGDGDLDLVAGCLDQVYVFENLTE